MKTFTHSINRFAVKAAIITAGFGVLQTLFFMLVQHNELIPIGFVFILCSLLIHVILLLVVLVNGIKHYKQIQEHILTIGILLFNIPLAIFCSYIITEF